MDWYNFHVLLTLGTIAGIPANVIAVKILYGFSCASCTICTAALMVVYAHYTQHHHSSLFGAAQGNYRLNGPAEGSASIRISDNEDEEKVSVIVGNGRSRIHPKHVFAELIISVAELTLKDDIQSGLLFWVSMTNTFTSTLSWSSVLFSVCSLLAHFKLFTCFVTKLFRLGDGEDADSDRLRWELRFSMCLFGCIATVVFEGLMIAYLIKASQV